MADPLGHSIGCGARHDTTRSGCAAAATLVDVGIDHDGVAEKLAYDGAATSRRLGRVHGDS
jgi:hypothetical protein